jgi:hypothetical protein
MMAEQAMFTIERYGREVHIKLQIIPDSPDDPDLGIYPSGIAFNRKDALGFAWRIIRASLTRERSNG